MKVAFITYQYPPKHLWGGSFYAYKLTHALEDLGIDVVRIGPSSMCDKGIKISASNLLHFAWKAAKHVGRTDLVHGNILGDLFITKKPCVTTMHHPMKYDFPQNSFKKIAYLWMERKCFRKAKAVITDSQLARQEFINLYGNESKIYSIPSGVDPVKKPRLGDSCKVLCATGLGPRKGLELALHAAQCLAEHSVEFYITGDGAEKKHLESLAAHMKLKNIHFLGAVTREKLEVLYSECGICLITSTYEGFGLPILEGMAHKKVVITTNTGIAPEAIENGKSGFILEERDPNLIASIIMKLIKDKALFRKLALNAYTTSKKFTWGNTAKKTIEIYETALSE